MTIYCKHGGVRYILSSTVYLCFCTTFEYANLFFLLLFSQTTLPHVLSSSKSNTSLLVVSFQNKLNINTPLYFEPESHRNQGSPKPGFSFVPQLTLLLSISYINKPYPVISINYITRLYSSSPQVSVSVCGVCVLTLRLERLRGSRV